MSKIPGHSQLMAYVKSLENQVASLQMRLDNPEDPDRPNILLKGVRKLLRDYSTWLGISKASEVDEMSHVVLVKYLNDLFGKISREIDNQYDSLLQTRRDHNKLISNIRDLVGCECDD